MTHTTLHRFRHIVLPRILWYLTGRFIYDELYSYYWLNIRKRPPLWPDAMECSQARYWCRYCGKGRK